MLRELEITLFCNLSQNLSSSLPKEFPQRFVHLTGPPLPQHIDYDVVLFNAAALVPISGGHISSSSFVFLHSIFQRRSVGQLISTTVTVFSM